MTKTLPEFDLTTNTEYAQAAKRYAELRQELQDTEQQISQLVAAANEEAESGRAKRLKLAEALADGEDPHMARFDSQELERARRHARILHDAVDLQRKRVGDARAKASKEQLDKHADEYRARVRRMVFAAVDLSQASDEERAFRDAAHDADVLFIWETVTCNVLGSLNDPDSRINWLIDEAVEYGYITKAEARKTGRKEEHESQTTQLPHGTRVLSAGAEGIRYLTVGRDI